MRPGRSTSSRITPALVALILLAASPANGADPPVRVPPAPLAPLSAGYPTGARGDARVLLELTIDRLGAVRSARVVEGEEPFAAAALAASTAFRFKPAEKDGAPVVAVIRAEIRFHEEPAPEPPPPPPEPSPEVPGKPKPVAPIEVTVQGEALAPAVTSLTRAEVRLLPGAFGDPFRAIEVMPGVVPIVSGIPYFFVRGAPPGNVGYFLDGIRVPMLYHLGLGPSVVHPAIVDRVDLYSGGYPARFGRFAGGIVAGETKGPADGWHGEANLRIVDAGALVEAPFDGGRGTALVGGRYSYTALLLHLFAPEVSLDYWDYQARATYDVTPRDRLTVFAFGSHDFSGEVRNGRTETLFDAMFHRLDIRYDHKFGPGSTLRHAVTLGYDVTGLDASQSISDRMLATRTELVHKLSDDAVLRLGADAVFDANVANLNFPDDDDTTGKNFVELFGTREELSAGIYADVVLRLSPRFEITPGVRFDLFESHGNRVTAVDPRLSARLFITKDVRLVQAYGFASQMPSFFLPGPGLNPDVGGGLQRSFQTSAGLELDLPLEITATATGFRNAFFDMTDPLGTLQPVGDRIPPVFDTRSDGQSVGLEVSIKRRLTKKLGGFAAYTLSRSTRTLPARRVVQSSMVSSITYPSSFDRTHVANVALSYDIGRGFRAGVRSMVYSGAPVATVSAYLTPDRWENPERLPPFFRLDARLEKRFTIGKKGWLSIVLEMLNATLSKEVIGVDCGGEDLVGMRRPKNCQEQEIGPVSIPSFGVEGGF